jgi:hypothetical protein
MTDETLLYALQPLEQSQPLAWCIVSADSEAEARQAASEQSPDHVHVDWLTPAAVECRRVLQIGGSAPPKGMASYFCERADVVGV